VFKNERDHLADRALAFEDAITAIPDQRQRGHLGQPLHQGAGQIRDSRVFHDEVVEVARAAEEGARLAPLAREALDQRIAGNALLQIAGELFHGALNFL
jgi:hypothetical protein